LTEINCHRKLVVLVSVLPAAGPCDIDHTRGSWRLISLPPLHSWVEAIMTHLIDKNFIERANAVLLLGILCAGLAICVLSALAYDVVYWLDDW
jgi:hypothetical protein